jgi:hypothetical protein
MKLRISIAVLLLLTAGCGSVLESLILRPSPTIRRTPADFGYAYETKSLRSRAGNGQISIWHVKTPSPRKGTIVLIPGNDSNKGRYTLGLPVFIEDGWDVVLMDYAGFGESDGEPTLLGLIDSARDVLQYAVSQDDNVVGYGVSLGTSVLFRVASEFQLRAAVFESAMDLWSEASLFAGRHLFESPVWAGSDLIAALSTSENYNSRHWVTRITCPKLFLHSPDDNVTPFPGAWELFTLSPQPKHFFVTQGEHALQLFLDPVMYRSVVGGWLDGVIGHDPILNEHFQELLDTEIRVTLEELGFTAAPL